MTITEAAMTLMEEPLNLIMKALLGIQDRNLVPDFVVKKIMRMFLSARLRSLYQPPEEEQHSNFLSFVHALNDMPIAIKTDKPNSQQYELPTSFYKLLMGKHMKFSACYFADDSFTLDDAEVAMLELYCDRAQIKDGHTVLDLGCGWGSFCLYIAERYSNCKVTGISNSKTQKAYIEEQCRERDLKNLNVIVADISKYEMDASFDRVCSVEMFEYMKNYKELFKKVAKWMKDDGLLFIHYFCHKKFAYHFEENEGELHRCMIKTHGHEWMARYYFTGGTMPSLDLFLYFQDDVSVINHWLMNGKHFARTSDAMLKNFDRNIAAIKPIMEKHYGKDYSKWTASWRLYGIALTEMFGHSNGQEWMVAHILFKKKT